MPIFRIILILIWAVLWFVSLSLPVVMNGNPEHHWPGVIVLMLGWMGLFSFQFGWLANLTFWGTGVLSVIKDAPVAVRVGAALFQIGLGIDALFWDTVADEGGVQKIDAFGSGYYVWLFVMFGSAVALLVVTMIDAKGGKRQARAEAEPPIH